MRQKNSPQKFKVATVKQYQGPSCFHEGNLLIQSINPRNNFRNYFYAQRYKSVNQRPSSCQESSKQKDTTKMQLGPSQQRKLSEAWGLGMKSFFNHTKSAVKQMPQSKFTDYSKSIRKHNNNMTSNQNSSSNSILMKQKDFYAKIGMQIPQKSGTTKLSTYKKKQKRLASGKNKIQIQIQQIMKQVKCETKAHLNIKSLKPHSFWSDPGAYRIHKNHSEIHRKLITEQMLVIQSPNVMTQYQSNIDSPDKNVHLNLSEKKIISKTITSKKFSEISLRASKLNTIINTKYKMNDVDYFGKIKQQMNIDEAQVIKIKYYKDIIWKVCFNSNIKVVVPPNQPSPRFFVGKGNNSKLIKSIISKRWWWKPESKQQNANFIWTQLKVYSVYQSQQSSTQFTAFQQQNSETQWPSKQYNQMKTQRNALLLTPQKYKNWHDYIINSKKLQNKSTQLLQSRKFLEKQMHTNIISKYPSKVSNHLEYSRMIGNKKALYKTLMLYFKVLQKQNQYLPVTYHVTSGLEDQQYLKFLNQYYHRAKNTNNTNWIVKPGEMSNRGNGITVCKQLGDVKSIIKNNKKHLNGKPYTYIIQEYLDRPFLYHGRKFDLRHYIMITSTNGRIQGYFYQEGYIRTTSYKYNVKTQKASVHLTNDAVQKYCKDYGKYEQGNKVSYDQFQKYLQSKYQGKYSFYETILPKIRQISTQLINSCYYVIDPKRRTNNFEIFGLDIMIDQNFKPWLIEANTNPCLQLSSKLLATLIPKMLDNALMIAVDPLFPPPSDMQNRRIKLPNNSINQNRFQLIFDEAIDGKKLNEAYNCIDKQLSNMEGFASDEQAYESGDDCEADY